jgi:hypothetical protein
MADKQYSNREIDRMFKEISETLGRIEEQTTKTNGRVTKLERNVMIVIVAVIVTTLLKWPEISKVFLNLI